MLDEINFPKKEKRSPGGAGINLVGNSSKPAAGHSNILKGLLQACSSSQRPQKSQLRRWVEANINQSFTGINGQGAFGIKPSEHLFWSTCCKPIWAIMVPCQIETDAEWTPVFIDIMLTSMAKGFVLPDHLDKMCCEQLLRSPENSLPALHISQPWSILYGYQ